MLNDNGNCEEEDYKEVNEDKLKEDEQLLTNINTFFPQLIWKQALKKLKERYDIANSSNASPFFGNLFQKKRNTEVLMPEVFGILARRYNDLANEDKSYKENNRKNIPWKLPRGRNKPHRMTGIWKCRLVCKSWNKAIEEVYRKEDAGNYQVVEKFKEQKKSELVCEYDTNYFDEESRVERFLDHFKVTHYDSESLRPKKCPFVNRDVVVAFVGDRGVDHELFFESVMNMLRHFGEEVWYFSFDCSGCTEVGQVYLYRKLVDMAKLMPNMKALRVTSIHHWQWELKALEQDFLTNPFPKLANLEMIKTYEIPRVINNHLVNQYRQIRRLLFVTYEQLTAYSSIFTDNLPNLRELRLDIDSEEDFERFEGYRFRMKLEKLDFYYSHYVGFVTWARVFNAIESKMNLDTCIELRLEMPKPRRDADWKSILEDSVQCRLKLANIQGIKVKQSDARFCVDFLLPSKNSLVVIELACNPTLNPFDQNKLQVIKFVGCEDKMQNSNIGSEFPRLKKLRVRAREGKRYFYEPDGVKVKEGWYDSEWYK